MRRGDVAVGALGQLAEVPRQSGAAPAGRGSNSCSRSMTSNASVSDRGGGWVLEEDITARPWGLRDFRLLDPDGYYWRITTPF